MTKQKLLLRLSAYKVVMAVVVLALAVAVGLSVRAYSGGGQAPKVVVEGDYIESFSEDGPVEVEALGALSGPEVHSYLRVHGRFSQGGHILTSSTAASATLPIGYVSSYSSLDYTLTSGAVNLTLPASSTMPLATGECSDWRFRNTSTQSASSTTFVAGAGIDLVENENGDVVIEGGNEARLTFGRELDADVTVYVDEYIAAD